MKETYLIGLTKDQIEHLYLLLAHETRELQDTVRLTDPKVYERCTAFNGRITLKLKKVLQTLQ